MGDTAGDQRAAAEAGYHFIAAGYGYGSDLVAAHQLQTPLELLRVLAEPAELVPSLAHEALHGFLRRDNTFQREPDRR